MKQTRTRTRSRFRRCLALAAALLAGYHWLERRARRKREEKLLAQPQTAERLCRAREFRSGRGLRSRHCGLALVSDGLLLARGLWTVQTELIPRESIRRAELTGTVQGTSLPARLLHLVIADGEERWYLLEEDPTPWLDNLLAARRLAHVREENPL